jgi:hypothetical protein
VQTHLRSRSCIYTHIFVFIYRDFVINFFFLYFISIIIIFPVHIYTFNSLHTVDTFLVGVFVLVLKLN